MAITTNWDDLKKDLNGFRCSGNEIKVFDILLGFKKLRQADFQPKGEKNAELFLFPGQVYGREC